MEGEATAPVVRRGQRVDATRHGSTRQLMPRFWTRLCRQSPSMASTK
jgi:hypothetical protein